MSDTDILRAAAGLRSILDERYPDDLYKPLEMSEYNKQSAHVPIGIQIEHLKHELDQIPKFLDIGTRSKREKAFRWLSDVGGVMRHGLNLVSIKDLGDLFRPEADQVTELNEPALPL